MVSLISLIISRSSTNQSSFTELTSINVFTSDSQVMLDVSDVTGSGKIDNNGLSYIRLNWEFPDSNVSGIYRCEANGVDRAGHPVNLNTSQILYFVQPDINSLVKQIQYLTNSFENIYTIVEQQNINLTNRLAEVSATEQELLAEENVWNTRLDKMKHLLFNISTIYAGHYYMLSSKHAAIEPETAEATCALFGGYLVEIDSYDEMQFVRNFISSNPNFNLTLTGGNDEAVEGHWVNRHSRTDVGYLDWASGEPNHDGNCIYLSMSHMSDRPCYLAHEIFDITFLCEVPQ
ncbi:uncharacterized protein LOC131958129 [Physella acuta]|uniref:uncharacterized protein LOC131958129 n=1 Tax=Physella acuta TaxID=109671 RepID=UPI0027DE534F|nr:uncharacterized protein LOC131958129 [Physella acuta]